MPRAGLLDAHDLVRAGRGRASELGVLIMEQRAASALQTPSAASAFDPIVVNRPVHAAHTALKVVAFNAHGGPHLDRIPRCLPPSPPTGAGLIPLAEERWGLQTTPCRDIATPLLTPL